MLCALRLAERQRLFEVDGYLNCPLPVALNRPGDVDVARRELTETCDQDFAGDCDSSSELTTEARAASEP